MTGFSSRTGYEVEPYRPLTPANSSPEPKEYLTWMQWAAMGYLQPDPNLMELQSTMNITELESLSYVKLAGNGWSIHLRSVCNILGSNADGKLASALQGQYVNLPIAAGVSRVGAKICFNARFSSWEFVLLEQNDASVDGHRCIKLQKVPLFSG